MKRLGYYSRSRVPRCTTSGPIKRRVRTVQDMKGCQEKRRQKRGIMKEKLEKIFLQKFGDADGVRYFFAPGRVNLMGEHVDYNGGMTLPCALTLGTYGAARKNGLQLIRLYSDSFPEAGTITTQLSSLENKKDQNWANYPIGVVKMFALAGYPMEEGFDLVVTGTLPPSSGLSSSASVEVLTAHILCSLYGFTLSVTELALLTKKAENEFIGVQCGILDQLSIAAGKAGQAIYMNTDTLAVSYAPFFLGDTTLLIVNSNKKRALNESKYNERRQECESALACLQRVCPKNALCDYTPEELERYKAEIPKEVWYRRARHAVTENLRTKEAFTALLGNDLAGFGKTFPASHKSLKEDYEVTGKELDFLADFANAYPGVLGARMTGAGFGGCVIVLIDKKCKEKFCRELGAAYTAATGLTADIYEAKAGQGPCEM